MTGRPRVLTEAAETPDRGALDEERCPPLVTDDGRPLGHALRTVRIGTRGRPADHGELEGPFVQGFWFSVTGPLRSKSNFRRSGRARNDWGTQRAFQDRVAALGLTARPRGWEVGDERQDVAERPQVVLFVYGNSLIDVPNLPKSVCDALEDVVYVTDASVRWCTSGGQRRRDGDGVVAVARLAPEATEEEVMAAAAALGPMALAAWRAEQVMAD